MQETPLPQIPRLTKEEVLKQQKAEHERLYATSSGCLLRTPHGKLARIYKGKEYDKKGRLICYLLEKENKKDPSKNTYQKSPVFYPGKKCIIVAYIP